MLRFLGRVCGLVCALLLAGCTGAPLVGLEVSDYRTTFNTTGDEQLLVNILRAKDNAPLHFSELQSIGASDQLAASFQATGPVGPLNGSTTRAGLQGMASAQATPTFSLSTLEVQQFTQGLTNPIPAAVIQQFLEEGIDQRLILILFFAGYTENRITYLNNLKCDPTEEHCYTHFYDYLKGINRIAGAERKIVAHPYYELTPMGASLPWPASTGVKDLAGIDPTKYRVEPDRRDPTRAVVYSISDQKLALCYVKRSPKKEEDSFLFSQSTPIVPGVNPSICRNDRVYVPVFRNNAQSANGLIVRSTYEIIEFLGQVLSFQEKERMEGQDRCLTVSGKEGHRTCEDDVLFQVNSGRGPSLVSTTYEGAPYTIASDSCQNPATCDHSGEVLKIVNLLININKSAANIPSIPLVRTIQ